MNEISSFLQKAIALIAVPKYRCGFFTLFFFLAVTFSNQAFLQRQWTRFGFFCVPLDGCQEQLCLFFLHHGHFCVGLRQPCATADAVNSASPLIQAAVI